MQRLKSLFETKNLSVYKETRNGMVGEVTFKIFGLVSYGLYFHLGPFIRK
jgi:hypothetical protein